MSTTTTIFVGESPPLDTPPDFRPFDCASGTLLAKHLGLVGREPLIERVRRVNLFDAPTGINGAPSWDAAAATSTANRLVTGAFPEDHRMWRSVPPGATLVALGRRVADAFGLPPLPLHYIPHVRPYGMIAAPDSPAYRAREIIVAPHLGDRSTRLKDKATAREFRRGLLTDLVLGSDLRVLDFRLDDIDVLSDLAHVVCPRAPQTAAAALRAILVREQRSARLRPRLQHRGGDAPIVDNLRVSVLADTFADNDPRAVLCTFFSPDSLVSAAEWGCSTKKDKGPYGDDLARAVVLEPTLARACPARAAELRGRP